MEKVEKAAFAAGCFWGVEEKFRQFPGVIKTTVGYCGGHVTMPTYQEVCSGETVLIEYDPNQLHYEQLLEIFWTIHDPTTLNQQGPDHGSQYRSAIFTYSDEQHKMAEATQQTLTQNKKFSRPIVTEIIPMEEFYPAEDYHQQYLAKQQR